MTITSPVAAAIPVRTKLDDRERGLIQTVRGVGYAIKAPAGEAEE
jgi:DNA-binding winged helix-turn-helix (wHTH) protein